MGTARNAARQLLNNEWSRGVWKHWLSHVFEPPVEPTKPAGTSSVAPSAAPPAAPPEVVNTAPSDVVQSKLDNSCSDPKSEPPDSASARDVRRSELRARFDALSDRLSSVEDGLETLLRRSALRDRAERRSDQQSVEMIDNVAVASERQATVLEGLLSTVARLEHGMARLEHGLSRVERALGERRRDSHFPAAPSQAPRSPSQFPESHLAPRERNPLGSRGSDVDELEPPEGAGINGHLSEVSLSTVMAMLEIERHSGRLKVATDDGLLASFELSEGSVVSSRLSENDADPLQTLRTALCWKQGRFWFRQQPAEPASFAPRSIGSLLLEATRQNDESFANVG
ncbi:MAG TPA: DUF4388 domain-containing protein [Polyangiaceae bacterium]|nr:DUF4388 domain-containing protein [Polyangiaceae bacterium]